MPRCSGQTGLAGLNFIFMENFTITFGTQEDHLAILVLYRTVAAVEGRLARTEKEITDDYVRHFVQKSVG